MPFSISIGSLALDKIFNLAGLLTVFGISLVAVFDPIFGMGMVALCILGIVLVDRLARPMARYFSGKEKKLYRGIGETITTLHSLSVREILIQVFLGGLFLLAEIFNRLSCAKGRRRGCALSYRADLYSGGDSFCPGAHHSFRHRHPLKRPWC